MVLISSGSGVLGCDRPASYPGYFWDSVLSSRSGFDRGVRPAAAILVYLHLTGVGALLVSGFWAIVNERFDPSTARRTIGEITAGGSLGGLLGGLLPERVGAVLPLTAMLPILAGLQLLAAGLVLGVEHGAPPERPTPGPRNTDAPLSAARILRNSSYLIGLALLWPSLHGGGVLTTCSRHAPR